MQETREKVIGGSSLDHFVDEEVQLERVNSEFDVKNNILKIGNQNVVAKKNKIKNAQDKNSWTKNCPFPSTHTHTMC